SSDGQGCAEPFREIRHDQTPCVKPWRRLTHRKEGLGPEIGVTSFGCLAFARTLLMRRHDHFAGASGNWYLRSTIKSVMVLTPALIYHVKATGSFVLMAVMLLGAPLTCTEALPNANGMCWLDQAILTIPVFVLKSMNLPCDKVSLVL